MEYKTLFDIEQARKGTQSLAAKKQILLTILAADDVLGLGLSSQNRKSLAAALLDSSRGVQLAHNIVHETMAMLSGIEPSVWRRLELIRRTIGAPADLKRQFRFALLADSKLKTRPSAEIDQITQQLADHLGQPIIKTMKPFLSQ